MWATGLVVKGGCRIGGNVPPYVIIAHNPATYYGIAFIMRKHGFTDEQIDDVAKFPTVIYQWALSVTNGLKRVEGRRSAERCTQQYRRLYPRNTSSKIAVPTGTGVYR